MYCSFVIALRELAAGMKKGRHGGVPAEKADEGG